MSRILLVAYLALPVLATASFALSSPETVASATCPCGQCDDGCACCLDGPCVCDLCACSECGCSDSDFKTTSFVSTKEPACCSGTSCNVEPQSTSNEVLASTAAGCDCGVCEATCGCCADEECTCQACACPLCAL